MRIVHVINPVKIGHQSDLFQAQPVTFESMRIAQEFALQAGISVELCTTQYPEDHEILPEGFKVLPDLERSVLNVGSFLKQRKLPLIHDIIDRANQFAEDEDYIIYSNVDIAVLPHFYVYISEEINRGYNSFTLTRRTLRDFNSYHSIHEMFSDPGKPHPGFDCFVFPSKQSRLFFFDNTCIGTTRIGLAILINLFFFNKEFRIINGCHLTFHLGDDKIWTSNELSDYVKHNEDSVKKVFLYFLKLNPSFVIEVEFLQKYYSQLFEVSDVKESKTALILKLFRSK